MVPIPSSDRSTVRLMVEPMTVPARSPQPYLHLDNRGMVMFDGGRCVIFAEAMLGWVRETFDLLLEEKRATRHRGDLFLGGMVSDDGETVTLYGGHAEHLATLELGVDALGAVRDRFRGG
jgi:hypothetical protein